MNNLNLAKKEESKGGLAKCTISSSNQIFFKLSGIEALSLRCKNFQEFVGANAPFRVGVALKFEL